MTCPHDTVTSGRALRNIPFRGPLDYAVMKSHLIVQSAFADVVFAAFPEKAASYIQAARLTFHQYGALARAALLRVPVGHSDTSSWAAKRSVGCRHGDREQDDRRDREAETHRQQSEPAPRIHFACRRER